MPRKTAADRHVESAPRQSWPPEGAALLDVLIAFHHPSRRLLYEALIITGPSSVGQLARITNMAPGSVSHHLKYLHKSGLITSASAMSTDSRESWWKAEPRSLTWDIEDFMPGTAGRAVVASLERADLERQFRAALKWLVERGDSPKPWRTAWSSSETFALATGQQVEQLSDAIATLIADWSRTCKEDARENPQKERRSIRALARVFPSEPFSR